MAATWKLGTRGSDLAQTQSRHVAAALEAHTGRQVELVVIQTKGDAVRDRPLRLVGGKGLFTKEIEDAMLAGDVDLAVHSMKDMPTEGPDGLVIAGVPAREDPRDAIVGCRWEDLPEGAVVGTGSARRMMQIQAARPDLVVKGIRGNVETRIGKMEAGEYHAVVLALSGLRRLGLDRRDDVYPIPVDVMVPAVGQGALAVQCRADDKPLRDALHAISCRTTQDAMRLERAFLAGIEGGCSVPAGCLASVESDTLEVRAFLGRQDGVWVRETGQAPRSRGAEAGAEIARRVLTRLGEQPARTEEGTVAGETKDDPAGSDA